MAGTPPSWEPLESQGGSQSDAVGSQSVQVSTGWPTGVGTRGTSRSSSDGVLRDSRLQSLLEADMAMRSLDPRLHLYQDLMEGFQADEMDKGNVRGSNKVGEIVKMMSDEEVDHVSHYRDKINVVDCNEMAIKEVMYVEPIKEVRFTWTMGLNKSRCIGVCGIRYNPLDKITELQWDKFMEEVKCKRFGPQNRQCSLKRNLAKCGKTGNEGTKGTWTRSTCRTSWTSSWITSLRSGGNFHAIKLIQNLIVIRSKTFI